MLYEVITIELLIGKPTDEEIPLDPGFDVRTVIVTTLDG